MSKKHVLIVEDDKTVNELIQTKLDNEGFSFDPVYSSEEALAYLKEKSPELIILDLMLPGINGLEFCKLIKADSETSHIPIIIITGQGTESDISAGLQLGVDDYLVKPFSPKVFMARVRATLRRYMETPAPGDQLRSFGDLVIDLRLRKVSYQDKPLELTAIEFDVLEFLSRYPGCIFSREQIMENVWKEGKFIVDEAVNVHINGLCEKINHGEEIIETVNDVGYRFKDAPAD